MQMTRVAIFSLVLGGGIAYLFLTNKAAKEKAAKEKAAKDKEKAAKEKAARQKAAEQKKAREKAEKAAVAAKMKLSLNEIVSDLFTFRKHFVNLQIIF